MSKSKIIILDFDGTIAENAWPDIGPILPGAYEACVAFRAAGHRLVLNSARLNPLDPFTGEERAPAVVMGEIQAVRDWLDRHGLNFVEIYTGPGKPGGDIYIDDKGERYAGTPGAWKRLAPKVLARLDESPAFYSDQLYRKEPA